MQLSSASKRQPANARLAHLLITGHVERPQSLCADVLQHQPSRLIENFSVSCRHDAHPHAPQCFRATPLAPLVACTRPLFDHHEDFKRMVVVAESDNGYRALFSWMELFHARGGDTVYLAFDAADAPLHPPRHGDFVLLPLGDAYTGPRHVRRLSRVYVQRAW